MKQKQKIELLKAMSDAKYKLALSFKAMDDTQLYREYLAESIAYWDAALIIKDNGYAAEHFENYCKENEK